MEIGKNMTKQRARRAMLAMLRQRDATTPNHLTPSWAHAFWNKRVLEPSEVKRVLGVGVAKMSDHLRLYKDPFDLQ